MTAASVDGRTVIATEQAESPLSKPNRPMHFKNIQRLLLDDGTVVFGCAHCDTTAATAAGLFSHVGREHPKPGVTPKPPGRRRTPPRRFGSGAPDRRRPSRRRPAGRGPVGGAGSHD